MAKVKVKDIAMNYEQQGSGEPLVLIPYLAADNACYAFQVAEYAKHFTCISVDPRGAGETDKPAGDYSTELFADDIAGFMSAIGVERAHVSGLSLGAAVGMLYAPRSGRVTRRFMRSKANSAVGYAKDRGEQWKNAAREQFERGKQRVVDTKTHISSAFEAGRQAYRDTSESFANADQA